MKTHFCRVLGIASLSLAFLINIGLVDDAHAYNRLKGVINLMNKVRLAKDPNIPGPERPPEILSVCVVDLRVRGIDIKLTSKSRIDFIVKELEAGARRIFNVIEGQVIQPEIVINRGSASVDVSFLLDQKEPLIDKYPLGIPGDKMMKLGCAAEKDWKDIVVINDYDDFFGTWRSFANLKRFIINQTSARPFVEGPYTTNIMISSETLRDPPTGRALPLEQVIAHELLHSIVGLADTYSEKCLGLGFNLEYVAASGYRYQHPLALSNYSKDITEDDRYGIWQAWAPSVGLGTIDYNQLNRKVPKFVAISGNYIQKYRYPDGSEILLWQYDAWRDMIRRWDLTGRLSEPPSCTR